jgi:hypothetical protein
MIGSVGHVVYHKPTSRRGRVVHGPAEWIGLLTTVVKFDDGTTDEVPDSELQIVDDKAIVLAPCPTCKTQTPHSTLGVKTDERGPHQRMKCAACGTVTNVYTGEGGKDFQANLDAPDGMN